MFLAFISTHDICMYHYTNDHVHYMVIQCEFTQHGFYFTYYEHDCSDTCDMFSILYTQYNLFIFLHCKKWLAVSVENQAYRSFFFCLKLRLLLLLFVTFPCLASSVHLTFDYIITLYNIIKTFFLLNDESRNWFFWLMD